MTVYDVNPGENKYVLKVVRGRDKMTQLRREIHYGTRPGLRKGFHVRVLGYKLGQNSGMYLMDHASFGARDVSVTMTAKDYMKSDHYDPLAFKTAFRKALQRFYRTFQGFHGDLHASNVMVNLKRKNGSSHYKIKNVILIDYANIVPFEQKKKTITAQNIQNAFAKIPNRDEYEEYPIDSGIQVKWLRVQDQTKTGQVPVRSNANMLDKLKNWKPLRRRP